MEQVESAQRLYENQEALLKEDLKATNEKNNFENNLTNNLDNKTGDLTFVFKRFVFTRSTITTEK